MHSCPSISASLQIDKQLRDQQEEQLRELQDKQLRDKQEEQNKEQKRIKKESNLLFN